MREEPSENSWRASASRTTPLTTTLATTMPRQPATSYTVARTTSESQAVGTQGRPSAVKAHGSWCGTPLSRIRSPVRMCHQMSGSSRGRVVPTQKMPPTTTANHSQASDPRAAVPLSDGAVAGRVTVDAIGPPDR